MLAPPVQRASPGSPHTDDLESAASAKTPEPESLAPPLLQRACASCEQEKQTPRWQAKYAVHPPGDRWEQEADRAAEAVTRGSPAPRLTEVSSGGLASGIQRRSRPSPPPSSRARHPAVRPDPVAQVLHQRTPGAPLHPPSRRQIESTLGADLTHVRVHTGPAAEEATESIQARAFTHGRDIWIGRGESPTDPELLAHESAHVVQQRAAPAAPTPPPAPAPAPAQAPAPAAPLQTTPQPAAAPAAPAAAPSTAGSGAPAAPTAPGAAGTPASTPAAARAPAPPSASSPGAPSAGPAGSASASGAPGQAPTGAGAPAPAPAAPASAGAPAGGTDVELRMPPPPDGLSDADQARLGQAQEAASETAAAQQSLPDPGTTVGEARSAVQEPAAETTARASGALAEALAQQPAPSPEIEELCERIRTVIRERRPPDEASLLQSNPQAAAQAAGGQLQSSVQSDAERVQSGYDTLNQPAEGSPQQQAQPLPGAPAAEAGAPIEASRAVPDAVPAENVSLDADVEASQSRMDEAGMSSEPAQLVESGPIAEAREAQGELGEAAQRDPAEVLAEQTASRAQASADMAALQQQALEALQGARAETVTGVSGGQTSMVGSEEQMRAQVSAQAQQIFDSAQSRVNALLEPLPTTAMRRWETGVQVLSTRFEQDLARLEEWKRERYSGVGGALLELWEGVVGMPDWVVQEYDRAESNFGDGVCSLIREISTEVNGVIATCEQIVDDARGQIARLFSSLPAELQEWAAGEQARFSEQLDSLRDRASAARDEFNRNLAERAAQSVQEVRQRIHELRQAAGGLLGRIADAVNRFLDDPARFILEGLLQLVGIPPASFWAVIDKIGQVIDDLANDPMGFANNLVAALGQGFQRFFDNFADHIVGGLFDWLFSGLGSVGVEIPRDFSLRSLITFFLQLMGITWPRIRELLARHIGEENVALLERAYEIIATLIEQGPSGIFEMIKDQLNPQTILDQVIQAAIDFLMEALVTQVAARIIALFNPAGAIVQAIEIIYRVLRWIFENAARIFALIETVVNGIADLIAGNIGGMAAAVEGALARLVAPVIDFLAGFLGLGNLPDRIADTIRGFQEWVLGILDRVIGWLAQRARSLLRALGLGGEEEEGHGEEGDGEVGKTVRFGDHRLWFNVQGTSVTAHSSSDDPGPVEAKLSDWSARTDSLGDRKAAAEDLISQARARLANAQEEGNEAARDKQSAESHPADATKGAAFTEADQEAEAAEESLATILASLYDLFGESSGLPVSAPVSMAGANHTLTVRDENGDLTVWIASREEPIRRKFEEVDRILVRWASYIDSLGDAGIKEEFEILIRPDIETKRTAALESTLGRLAGLRSRERESLKEEAEAFVRQLASEISAWAVAGGMPVQDFSDAAVKEALDRQAEEAAEQVWLARKAETQRLLEGFAGEIQALDPAARLKYRGSLAKGRRGVSKDFAQFDPNNYDVDFFVESDKLYLEAVGTVTPSDRGETWADSHPALRAMMQRMSQAYDSIPGVRIGDFSLKLRRVSNVQRLLSLAGTREYAGERHVTISPPPTDDPTT